MSDDVVFKAQLCVFFFKLHYFSSNEISSGSCSVISLIYQSLEFSFILRAVLGDPRLRDISAVLQRRGVLGLVLAEAPVHLRQKNLNISREGGGKIARHYCTFGSNIPAEGVCKVKIETNGCLSFALTHPPTSSSPMILLRMAIILFFAQK